MNQAQVDDHEREPIPFVADTDPLLRAQAAAKQLDVSKGMIYRLINEGRLVGVNVGRLVRVRQSDLDAYIAGLPAIRPTVAR